MFGFFFKKKYMHFKIFGKKTFSTVKYPGGNCLQRMPTSV